MLAAGKVQEGSLTGTSRTIVRTGIATFFGGTDYDENFRAYYNGPLLSYGLSTVKAYLSKREPDTNFVLGQNPGRGMGAFAEVELPETIDRPLTTSLIPAQGGQRRLTYPVRLNVFHMAMQPYAEDAEADCDALDQAIHELLYSDPTLGGVCYQAGMSSGGIHTQFSPAELWKEITLTHFAVEFDAEVQIVV